jgi:hypothetical protein
MSLDETQPRRDVFTVCREGRLSRDAEGVYWLASDEGGSPAAAQATFVTAADELEADGDIAALAPGEDGSSDYAMTPAGVSLWDSWNTPA